jgi:rhamnosyltransferase
MDNQQQPKVNVLLSTYNGEKFLTEQIDSILDQSDVLVQLFVRDDGSRDSTSAILKTYLNRPNIHINLEANVGWKKSFTHLLQNVSYEPTAYYAFADQDDVWQSDKLISAVQLLASHDHEPAVYHGNVAIVDGNMHFQQNRFGTDFQPNSHFPEAYFDGLGVGATMVFNAPMMKLIQTYQPKQATNHDALVMALGNMFGTVVFDSTAHILYRRHDGTATGFGAGTNAVKPTLMDRYRKYQRGPKQQFSIRAQELLAGYQELMNPQQLKLLTKIATYRNHFGERLYLLVSPRVVASGVRKTLQVKYRVLMGTL